MGLCRFEEARVMVLATSNITISGYFMLFLWDYPFYQSGFVSAYDWLMALNVDVVGFHMSLHILCVYIYVYIYIYALYNIL